MVESNQDLHPLLVAGLSAAIAGYGLGEVVDQLLPFFGEYDDNETFEAENDDFVDVNNNNLNRFDSAGTAAGQDLLNHLITSIVGWLIFTVIGVSGALFTYWYMPKVFEEDGLECNFSNGIDRTFYNDVFEARQLMTRRANCLTAIDDIFRVLDLNNDGVVDRCEDARFQIAAGSTQDYALKFSEAFNLHSFEKICYEEFAY